MTFDPHDTHDVRPEDVRTGPPPDRRPAGPGLSRNPVRLAWMVAIGADVLQWIAFPLFAPGAAAPWNDVLDVFVAVVLVRLIGWHWLFLPSFVVELLPMVDLAPTWTAAVFLATRGHRKELPGR